MSLPLYLLLLVALSYGQPNTTHVTNSSLHSVLVDLIPSAKQEDRKSLQEVTSVIPKTDSEPVTKQTETDTSDQAASEPERCSNGPTDDGICVPYYRCKDFNLTENRDPIDIANPDMYCTSYLDVCCLPINVINTTAKTDVIGDNQQVNISCGHHNPEGVGPKFVTELESSVSAFGEFPWTVAVLRIEPVAAEDPEGQKLNIYLGGGSLIHPGVVLTAAHVVHKDTATQLRVRAGEWDTQTTKELYPHQDRDVKEVILHPDFGSKNLHNDIALLFLSSPVIMSSPHIGVACLPNNNFVDYSSKTMCFASGWGKDRFGKQGRYSVVLKKVKLPLVEHETCEQQLQQTRLGARFHLDSSFICAGGEVGKDTCVGDGGAPLVCLVKGSEDTYVQNGVVAWGIGCGGEGIPAAYVNVAKFRSWIDQNVVGRGFDSKIYSI